ncbi:MAG: hypothetical protein CFE21_07660 [Bacteroidetes bacterium B1(2017)]|nr:MAG: hypothetical protein CFE21_07660 [Bacteroidetes bacterium B1(2017)]
MRILLDIDGVMVPAKSWKSVEKLEDGFACFNITAATLLQKIISETGATIVLTTSHKSLYSIVEWKNIFSRRGVYANFDKLADNGLRLSRKDEILSWLKKNNSNEKFVILDDDTSLNDLPIEVKSKLVLTSPYIGLNIEKADFAIKILQGQ